VFKTTTTLLFACATVAVASAPAAAASRASDGAVVIRASGATSDGMGAGTIVAVEGTTVRIVTAKHVATFGALTVRLPDGTKVAAHVVEASPDRDLAVIEAKTTPDLAAGLHVAPIADATSQTTIHVWGSGLNGPELEPGRVARVGAPMPDGDPRGRFAIACDLCHEGDSGGGVFDERGRLVGVYIGYFEDTDTPRVSVAEATGDAVEKIARSKTSISPSSTVVSNAASPAIAKRNAASNASVSAVASDRGRSSAIVLAAFNPTR